MGFLGRAKKMLRDLGTESPGREQYFSVLCASGHRVRGERTEGYQALRCPACGEGVFVLPRSPLPEPAAPPGMTARRARSARPRGVEGPVELSDAAEGTLELDEGAGGLADDQILWDDDPGAAGNGSSAATGAPRVAPEDLAAAEIDAARRKQAAAARRPGSAPAGRGRPVPGSGQGRGPEARPARPQPGTAGQPGAARLRRAPAASTAPGPIQAAAPRRRTGPNVPLIFFLLGLLVVGAIGWRAWRHRREQLPRVVERGREEGIPALEEGDFDRAYQLLSAARDAVNSLGGAVNGADEIREAADEADLFVNLCPEKLEDLLARAGRSDRDAWNSEFATLYKGSSCLFDTTITSTPAEGGGYEIAYIVFPPGEASRFADGGLALPDRYARVDLEGFELFEQANLALNAHVTFGAKIQSLDYDAAKKHWVIRLDPKSGRIIRHHKALEASGWPSPEAAQVPEEERP